MKSGATENDVSEVSEDMTSYHITFKHVVHIKFSN